MTSQQIIDPLLSGISIVIPAYRSVDCLPDLHQRLAAVMRQWTCNAEIIIIEDGSGDLTWNTIQNLARRDERVRGVRLSRNYGQHNALLCGIREARYATLVTLDDDLQHPPEEIPRLLNVLSDEIDLIYGVFAKTNFNPFRRFITWITKTVLVRAFDIRAIQDISPFRVFRTALRDGFAAYNSPNVSIDVLLSWSAHKVIAIEVSHERRSAGRSGYTFGRLLRYTANLLMGFSVLPLRLASIAGILMLLAGGLFLANLLGQHLLHGEPFTDLGLLVALIVIFSGVQLFALGIMAEYIARIFFGVLGKTAYTIRERTS